MNGYEIICETINFHPLKKARFNKGVWSGTRIAIKRTVSRRLKTQYKYLEHDKKVNDKAEMAETLAMINYYKRILSNPALKGNPLGRVKISGR